MVNVPRDWAIHYPRWVDGFAASGTSPDYEAGVEVAGAWTPEADVELELATLPDGRYRLVTEEHETETYSSIGRLESIANRAGITHTLIYDSFSPR